jgi:hypothetical protein
MLDIDALNRDPDPILSTSLHEFRALLGKFKVVGQKPIKADYIQPTGSSGNVGFFGGRLNQTHFCGKKRRNFVDKTSHNFLDLIS